MQKNTFIHVYYYNPLQPKYLNQKASFCLQMDSLHTKVSSTACFSFSPHIYCYCLLSSDIFRRGLKSLVVYDKIYVYDY